jgi:ABC-type uncharacterized transport system permease subunit
MGAQYFLAYRGALAIELLIMLLRVFLLKMVWTAVYGGRASVEGLDLDTVVAYLTLANIQNWFIFPGLAPMIADQVRDGQIAVELARPLPYLRRLLAQQLGQSAALVPFVVIVLPVALIVGGLRPPASPLAGLLYLVSAVLAYGVVTATGLLLGLLAFWTVEIGAFQTIRYFVAQFFGGVLVPLWFFPDWLRALAGVLPFQAETFIPLSIYFGQASGLAAAQGLAVQLAWLVALYALGAALWRRAIRRVVVQGG